jgi:hypothetical protein
MARKCASAAILETLGDPRVVTMPAAAQLVWIRVVTAMQKASIGVLRFGSEIMNHSDIALFIAVRETELETHLKTIVERGLLTIDGDGAIACPMLIQAISRSEINKINGSKGGRPRKDRSPPGQVNMMLPITGGKQETKITESGTESGTEIGALGGATTYLPSESVKSESVVEVSETEFEETGRAVLAAMGVDEARSFLNYGQVRQWLADGADRELILGVVKLKTGPHVHSLNYFNAAIKEAIAARPRRKPDWERQYEADLSTWELMGKLEKRPDYNDYRARAA